MNVHEIKHARSQKTQNLEEREDHKISAFRAISQPRKLDSITDNSVQDFEVPGKEDESKQNLDLVSTLFILHTKYFLKSHTIQNFEAAIRVQKRQTPNERLFVVLIYSGQETGGVSFV